MEKQFLFITPLTPSHLLDPVRKKLFELYRSFLLGQSYTNWKVLLLGEENGGDEKFIRIKTDSLNKWERLVHVLPFIKEQGRKPDFVIRLDDDDFISPYILEKVTSLDFDCYADTAHHFYDIVYGQYCSQKRPFLANTIIHKTEHVFFEFGNDKTPLLQCDHDEAWHVYYGDKKIIYSARNSPLYLRSLSPTSITSEFSLEGGSVDWKKYNGYTNSFGSWKNKLPSEFQMYAVSLRELAAFYHPAQKEKLGLLKTIKKRLRE